MKLTQMIKKGTDILSEYGENEVNIKLKDGDWTVQLNGTIRLVIDDDNDGIVCVELDVKNKHRKLLERLI